MMAFASISFNILILNFHQHVSLSSNVEFLITHFFLSSRESSLSCALITCDFLLGKHLNVISFIDLQIDEVLTAYDFFYCQEKSESSKINGSANSLMLLVIDFIVSSSKFLRAQAHVFSHMLLLSLISLSLSLIIRKGLKLGVIV